MVDSTFTCDDCGQTWPTTPEQEAEAQAEANLLFPGLPAEDRAVVCDDCFHYIRTGAMMAGEWPVPV